MIKIGPNDADYKDLLDMSMSITSSDMEGRIYNQLTDACVSA